MNGYTYLLYFIIFLLSGNISVLAQSGYSDTSPPNTFRSPENPFYWQNRQPFDGYWQQDVYYRIKANISEFTNIIDAMEQLTYWNNSPDTLQYVYFHLYQNAFQPGSYYHELNEANRNPVRFGKYEADGKGTIIEEFTITETEGSPRGYKPELIYDNTLVRVELKKALPPGASIDFNIKFKTYFDQGSMRRRMDLFNVYGYRHYNGVHWYPRIAVYDRKFGWNTNQHMDKEFYGDFGTFDVQLNFASNFIVEATGTLQNKDEVLPEELLEKLDIKNFKDKPLYSPPSEIIPYNPNERKTWHFYAENVHDFAFTADPTYRIGTAYWDGIECVALVQEPHASRWQNAADYTAEIIKVYSQDFGRYAYPKIVVADARDGMEYPMITLDNGFDPGYRDLLAHEVGHNWFFGMLGSNETYRAMMDEGFTQFLDTWAIEQIDGKYMPRGKSKYFWINKFRDPVEARNEEVYYGYMRDAVRGNDAALNTHSSDFGGGIRHGGGYRHVYYKTAAMLFNMQYVLGDSLFQDAMKNYVNQWQICHPYPEDFRNSIIHYTKVDLNWFFDQWMETTKSVDYKISNIKKADEDDHYEVTFKRVGSMEMPLDFRVVTGFGDTMDFHIPNHWFVKETDAEVLDKWYGFGELNRKHTVDIYVPGGIKNLVIDPSYRMPDVNILNNRKKRNLLVRFDSKVWNYPQWKQYELYWRPDVWYNSYDGFKLGWHFHGHYFNFKHTFHFTAWYNTGLLQGGVNRLDYEDDVKNENNYFSYHFKYQTAIDEFIKGADFFLQAKYLDGLQYYKAGIKQETRNHDFITISFRSMIRRTETDLLYALYPDHWNAGKRNHALDLIYSHPYRFSSATGELKIGLRSTALAGDYDYHFAWMEVRDYWNFWKLQLRSRLYMQYGTGTALAPESALYLAGANQEEMLESPIIRSQGFVPDSWLGFGPNTNHFQQGGGLNLRGYAGYQVVEELKNDSLVLAYNGFSGAALNLELDLDGLVNIKQKWLKKNFHLDTYLFMDVGTMLLKPGDKHEFSALRMDAGFGTAFTFKQYRSLQMVKDLVIRFDMPFFLSHTPADSPEHWQFRFVMGIERSF